MERLTTKRKDGRWALKNDDGATPWEQINKVPRAIERLAAYEDTGLEPEEVKEFLEDVESRFVLWINKRYGIPAMKFMDIMQAEKEGRLVVLPRKVGDLVFALWDVPTKYKYVIYYAEIKEVCIYNRVWRSMRRDFFASCGSKRP